MRRIAAVALCMILVACATQSKTKKTDAPEAAATTAANPTDVKPTDPTVADGKPGVSKKKAAKAEKKQAKAQKAAVKAEVEKAAQAAAQPSPETEAVIDTKQSAPRVTLNAADCTLGMAIDHLAREVGGSLVAMGGLEARPIGDVKFQNAAFDSVAQHFAGAAGCACQAYPRYWFIYPPGYEALLELSLAGAIDPAVAAKSLAVSFSPGTPLFKAVALISSSLGAAVVVDNVVGSAVVGPTMLAEMPLQDVLEALLRSARVTPGAFKGESTPEYVFIHAAPNPSPRTTLLNADTLTPEQNAVLDKEVSLTLLVAADDPAQLNVSSPPQPLGKMLETLSRQLGVEVALADRGLADIPIYPCVLPKVRMRTAMDLIIRQWPDPAFGYLVKDGKLVIQRIVK